MRFPIDVVFVDRAGVVLRSFRDLGAFRFVSGGRRARRTIELPAGTLDRIVVRDGDTVTMEAV